MHLTSRNAMKFNFQRSTFDLVILKIDTPLNAVFVLHTVIKHVVIYSVVCIDHDYLLSKLEDIIP